MNFRKKRTNPLVIVGMALVVIAMSFKITIVPFHMWTPDVYTGAPTPVTGFLSAAAKAAGFAVFVRVILTGIPWKCKLEMSFGYWLCLA